MPGIDVELVLHAGRFERRAQLRDIVRTDAFVLIAPVPKDGAVHFGRDLDRRGVGTRVGRETVIRDGRGNVVASGCEQEGLGAAHAEPDRSNNAVHLGPCA